jgi:phosphonate transport system substrate-binding protein
MHYLIFLVIFLSTAEVRATEGLRIGLIPEQNIFQQLKRYEPLGTYIESKTGIKIKFTMLSKYGNVVENFQKMELDGAFWGSFTGAIATQRLNVQHIARPVNLDGTSSYKGYIFTHRNSGITSIQGMRNKVFVFVDRATTAGYLYPLSYFRENGINDINDYLDEYYFAGSHDASIHAVLDGEADIGSAKNTVFDAIAEKDSRVKSDLVILATSIDVPSNDLGMRKDIDTNTITALQSALLTMDESKAGIVALNRLRAKRFVKATASDYKPVYRILNAAGIDIDNYNFTNN